MDNPVWDWAYELAAHLGWYNVEAMLASAPAGQLAMWRRHFEKRPFGSNWHMFSMVAAQIINAIKEIEFGFKGVKMKESDYLRSDVFVPKFTKQRVGQLRGRVISGGKALTAAFKSMLRIT